MYSYLRYVLQVGYWNNGICLVAYFQCFLHSFCTSVTMTEFWPKKAETVRYSGWSNSSYKLTGLFFPVPFSNTINKFCLPWMKRAMKGFKLRGNKLLSCSFHIFLFSVSLSLTVRAFWTPIPSCTWLSSIISQKSLPGLWRIRCKSLSAAF